METLENVLLDSLHRWIMEARIDYTTVFLETYKT